MRKLRERGVGKRNIATSIMNKQTICGGTNNKHMNGQETMITRSLTGCPTSAKNWQSSSAASSQKLAISCSDGVGGDGGGEADDWR